MSQENVDMVRRAFEAFNRGNRDAAVADVAPDFEYVASGAIPGATGNYRGPEGFKRFTEWLLDQFDDVRVDLTEVIEAGDQVVVRTTSRGAVSAAASRPAGMSGRSGLCATARPCAAKDSQAERRRSKPPGCGSRRPLPA